MCAHITIQISSETTEVECQVLLTCCLPGRTGTSAHLVRVDADAYLPLCCPDRYVVYVFTLIEALMDWTVLDCVEMNKFTSS